MSTNRPKKPRSLWRTVRAIAWSFVGLRAQGEYEQDVKNLNPLHLIAAGLVGVFIFIGALMALVHYLV